MSTSIDTGNQAPASRVRFGQTDLHVSRLCQGTAFRHLPRAEDPRGLQVLHHCLDRGDPQGKGPAIVLYQNADEALQRSKYRPVHHVWLMVLPVGPLIGKIEAFREVEVELDCSALPNPADGILNLDVYLGAVENAATLVNVVLQVSGIQRVPK